MNIHPSKKSELIFVTEKYEKEILESEEMLIKLGFASNVKVQKDESGIEKNAISIIQDDIKVYIPFEELVDLKEEKARLKNEKEKLEAEVQRCEKMLSNPGFTSKAPEAKINEEKEKLIKYKDMLEKVEERLKNI